MECTILPLLNANVLVAERKNRQILEGARSMMREKHMPNFYWAEAASTMHHQRSARANSIRDPRWKEANPIAPQSVRKHCECTHPEQKAIEARHEVGEMYPHRIFVQVKGIQALQPDDLIGSGKSRCSLR